MIHLLLPEEEPALDLAKHTPLALSFPPHHQDSQSLVTVPLFYSGRAFAQTFLGWQGVHAWHRRENKTTLNRMLRSVNFSTQDWLLGYASKERHGIKSRNRSGLMSLKRLMEAMSLFETLPCLNLRHGGSFSKRESSSEIFTVVR